MRLSKKYAVPDELALLYDFVNSLDRRSYMDHGHLHAGRDELGTISGYRAWLAAHQLPTNATRDSHSKAIALRGSLRAFLKVVPDERLSAGEAKELARQGSNYPLIVTTSSSGIILQPEDPASAVGAVLAQLYRLSNSGDLDRLKMCASEECSWIFFDRSKPGNRRWCSSDVCGNRHKARAYRERQREALG